MCEVRRADEDQRQMARAAKRARRLGRGTIERLDRIELIGDADGDADRHVTTVVGGERPGVRARAGSPGRSGASVAQRLRTSRRSASISFCCCLISASMAAGFGAADVPSWPWPFTTTWRVVPGIAVPSIPAMNALAWVP